MRSRRWLLALLVSLGAIASGQAARAQPARSPRLARAWESAPSFRQPESVIYDADRDVLYVSNVDGPASAKNARGFLSKVSLDGKVIVLRWVKELDAPKGMAIFGGKLYVSDIDKLVEVDLATGQVTNRYPGGESKFLNDVTADANGTIYVSDMHSNAIYRLSHGRLDVWLRSSKLDSPNGLHAEGERLIVAAWGSRGAKGSLKAVDFATKTVADLGSRRPVGNLDGLEPDGLGGYFVTDYAAGTILHATPGGEVTVLKKIAAGTADIDYIQGKKLLVVPVMNSNRLIAFRVE